MIALDFKAIFGFQLSRKLSTSKHFDSNIYIFKIESFS